MALHVSSSLAGSAAATINIERRSASGVAPDAFIFSVSTDELDTPGPAAGQVYDPRFHELYYFWDFDDAYTFAAPQNLHPAHKNANVAYGPKASHTFRAPGVYRVTCRVVEPATGRSATGVRDITVGDPNPLFPGINTIFLSPSGDFSQAPAGARLVTSGDLSGAINTWGLGNAAMPKRLMLNRGEAYICSGTGYMGLNAAVPTLHIVASDGAGAKPQVTTTGGMIWNDHSASSGGSSKDWIIQNLDFFGPFDSTTYTGSQVSCIETFRTPPNLLLIDGCLIDGFGHAIFNSSIDPNTDHRVTVLNDSVITNYANWGIGEANKTATALTGSRLMSDVNALVDSTPNQGAPYRGGANDRLTIVHSCDFFCRQGWSGHGNYIATQPSIRFNSEGFEGAQIVCQASAFEGGSNALVMTRADGSTANAVNAVIEKCYMVGTYQSAEIMSTQYGGTTIRNNIMVMPNAGRLPTQNLPYAFIQFSNPDGDALNQASPMAAYNNTLVNLWTSNAMTETTGASNFTTTNIANNLLYQPDADASSAGEGPLDTTILWAPREIGYRSSSVSLQSQTATPGNTVALYAPLEESGALGDALRDPTAYDDFFGVRRPQYPSCGALEMP